MSAPVLHSKLAALLRNAADAIDALPDKERASLDGEVLPEVAEGILTLIGACTAMAANAGSAQQ